MELDAEKVIQEKVRLYERAASNNWNKEWVWSRIETPSKRKTGFMWYAAAAIVVGLLSISLYLISVKYENEMMAQLNRLELLMDKLPTRVAFTEITEEKCIEEPEAVADLLVAPIKRTKITSSKNNLTPNITMTDLDTTSLKIELPSFVNPQETLVSVNEESLVSRQSENTISPIIGRISQSQNPLSNSKTKEIKIQLFQIEDYQKSLITDAREYKILSANFKNN